MEKSALDNLNTAFGNSVQAQIDAEREKTIAAIDGARERIKIYEREIASMAQLGKNADQEYINKKKTAINEQLDYISGLEAKLDPRDKDRYENTVHQDVLNLLDNKNEILGLIGQPPKIFEGDALYSETFKAFIINPKAAVAVKEVSIESSKLSKLQNAVIYDVPGFDSPTAMHLEQTKKRMKEADGIMLVASAEKPSFTAPALNMFQEVVDEDNVFLSDKLFIFGNRADGATTLSKNINTLKSEAKKWKLLSDSLLNERLIVGSAKAHLQKIGVVDGDDLVKKVESPDYQAAWSHGDGIEYAYNKLVEYNQTERFDILKKKVRRNNEELREIFNALKERYSGGVAVNYGNLLGRVSDLTNDSRESIQKQLKRLRKEIVDKYNDELVLSQRLQNEISNLFADGAYMITEDEINEEDLERSGVGKNIDIEKTDSDIREQKFEQIYNDFSKCAFTIAQNDHSEYYKKIVDCFESALGITSKMPNYDELHTMVVDFIGKCRKDNDDDFIYQPLIERFVRDIVEVLIKCPYSHESRLKKFVAEAEVFSGLVMFYNPGDADSGYKSKFLSVAPKNQPLLLSLVFHDFKDSAEKSKTALDYINGICKGLCDNPEIIQLVFSIVKLDPIGAVDAIKKNITKNLFSKCQSVDDYSRTAMPMLRTIKNNISSESASNNKKYDFDFTNPAEFEKQYKLYFGDSPVRDYDIIKDFFEKDLEILEDFLIHASIPAIRLEKPFVAREVQSINKLYDMVSSREFNSMIDSNAGKLLPMVYEEMEIANANIAANKLAVSEVEKIMKTLESSEIA